MYGRVYIFYRTFFSPDLLALKPHHLTQPMKSRHLFQNGSANVEQTKTVACYTFRAIASLDGNN